MVSGKKWVALIKERRSSVADNNRIPFLYAGNRAVFLHGDNGRRSQITPKTWRPQDLSPDIYCCQSTSTCSKAMPWSSGESSSVAEPDAPDGTSSRTFWRTTLLAIVG